ncbi:MAG: hypothetical protein AAF993_11545 [Pseudomonadota bacterium]
MKNDYPRFIQRRLPLLSAGQCLNMAVISIGLSFAALTVEGQAQTSEDCAQIENARERLACFDRAYPRNPDKPAVLPQITDQPIRAPGSSAAPAAPAQPSTPPPPVPAAAPTGEADSADATSSTGNADLAPIRDGGAGKSKSMFDRGEKIDFTATVAAVLSRDKQKMVFRLDNEQIWIQDSPRPLPIREGDVVKITSGIVGGFLLRTEGGTSTRVHRIK